MDLLALRNADWAWCTAEHREYVEGSRVSAGVNAQERIMQGAPMVLVEQIELRMVLAAAFRVRGQIENALEQMDIACDRARGVPIDLRCLVEAQRAEVVSSSDLGLRQIEESAQRLLQFRNVFLARLSKNVACTVDAVLARASIILGDAVGALEWIAKNDAHGCICYEATVWMNITRAQSYVLLERPVDALAVAESAVALVESRQGSQDDATVWSAVAEIAWQCGDLDQAWQWATRSIDAGQVRPRGVTPEFMPGDIVWTLGN